MGSAELDGPVQSHINIEAVYRFEPRYLRGVWVLRQHAQYIPFSDFMNNQQTRSETP